MLGLRGGGVLELVREEVLPGPVDALFLVSPRTSSGVFVTTRAVGRMSVVLTGNGLVSVTRSVGAGVVVSPTTTGKVTVNPAGV